MQRWSSPAISQIVSVLLLLSKMGQTSHSRIVCACKIDSERAVVACFLKLCLSRSTDRTKTSSSTMSGHPRRRKLNEKNERFL